MIFETGEQSAGSQAQFSRIFILYKQELIFACKIMIVLIFG